MGEKTRYAIVGSGWRADFYLTVARRLPERFEVCGLVTRSPEKGQAIEAAWSIPTYRNIDALLAAQSPSFAVVSVTRTAAPELIRELAQRGIPVLTETPPAAELEELIALNRLTQQGAKIQVAEQYPFQPMHAARIAVASSGALGTINEAQVSFSHGYHGTGMIRRLLGVTFENARIHAFRFSSQFVAGPGRGGPGETETMLDVPHDIALLDFGGRLGVFDFAQDQHRSYVRSPRILVRGSRGEIHDREVRRLADFRTPVRSTLTTDMTGLEGNLEGFFIRGVSMGGEWVYVNPFPAARFSEEEVAVATCVQKMSEYAAGGPAFYSLAEASQDRYLDLMISRAITTGEAVSTVTQPWAT